MRRYKYTVLKRFGVKNGKLIPARNLRKRSPRGETLFRHRVGAKYVDYGGPDISQSETTLEALKKGYLRADGFVKNWNPVPIDKNKDK